MVLSYVYAFVGGFTDAANAIATSVGTRVLSPAQAVVLAGVCNLAGGLTGTAVAVTIGQGLVDPGVLSLVTVIAALTGAMSWSLLMYRFGLPVSETHGLVGGLIGSGVASAGIDVVQWNGLLQVLVAIVASPALGFAAGFIVVLAIYWTFQGVSRGRALPWFVRLQRLSAAYMAFSHGRNDAQKPMGMLALALALYAGSREVLVPVWIVVSCALVAALGTAYGGWRIIRTLGSHIVRLDPVQGFAAEMSGGTVLVIASEFGIPVSTTHSITAAILGVGAARRRTAVRWTLFLDILRSWLLTVPATFAMAFLFTHLLLMLQEAAGRL